MCFCTVVNCMDGRVQLPVIKYMQSRFNVKYVDSVTEPGPDLILSEGVDKDVIESMLRRINISVEKHLSVAIALTGHHECTANPVTREEHRQQVIAGVQFLRLKYPDIPVVGLWIDGDSEVHELIKSENSS